MKFKRQTPAEEAGAPAVAIDRWSVLEREIRALEGRVRNLEMLNTLQADIKANIRSMKKTNKQAGSKVTGRAKSAAAPL